MSVVVLLAILATLIARRQSKIDRARVEQDLVLRSICSRRRLLLCAKFRCDQMRHPSDEFLDESFHRLRSNQLGGVLHSQSHGLLTESS